MFPTSLRINSQTPSSQPHFSPLCSSSHWPSFMSSTSTCSAPPQDPSMCCGLCVKYFLPHSPGSNLHPLYSPPSLAQRGPPFSSPLIRFHYPREHPPYLLRHLVIICLNKWLQNYLLQFCKAHKGRHYLSCSQVHPQGLAQGLVKQEFHRYSLNE